MTAPRLATPRTPERATFGPKVADMAAALGRPFLPWQRLVADVTGELDPDTGRMAYPFVVVSVPRRAGKTVLALATALQRLTAIGLARCWYTAQTGSDVAKAFGNSFVPLLEASPVGAAYRIRRSAGSWAITERPGVLRRGGGSFGMFTPVEHALHGQDADVSFIDEAWNFSLDVGRAVEAALGPAQATRDLAQTWVVSAGGTESSVWWDEWLTRAEEHAGAGGRHGIALFDWGALDGADPLEPATWTGAHPALGYTIDPAFLANALSLYGLEHFERHYLNRWPRPSSRRSLPVDADAWTAGVDVGATLLEPATYAFDVAPDRSSAAIAAVCDLPGGVSLVTVRAHRRGTGWLVGELAGVDGPIVADSLAGAATAALLSSRHAVPVTLLGASDAARATGAFVDAVNDHRLVHHGQAPLDDALAGVVRRALGDVWVWSRARSGVDITPLVAATLAVYQHTVAPAMTPGIY